MHPTWLDKLLGVFRRRGLASQPSIWGKLPGYGDYVRHHVSVEQAQVWQRWTSDVWLNRPAVRHIVPRPKSRGSECGWTHLKQPKATPDLTRVAIAFVMPPGRLLFAPKHYVQGVMIDSHDRVGRACPLIIYQCITPERAQRAWCPDGQSDRIHVLFWLARLAAQVHDERLDIAKLSSSVDEVCRLHEPGWSHHLGADQVTMKNADLRRLVNQFGNPSNDQATGLKGVRHLPWADWPQRLFRNQHQQSAFWVQDSEGCYVTASDDLFKLWGGGA